MEETVYIVTHRLDEETELLTGFDSRAEARQQAHREVSERRNRDWSEVNEDLWISRDSEAVEEVSVREVAVKKASKIRSR